MNPPTDGSCTQPLPGPYPLYGCGLPDDHEGDHRVAPITYANRPDADGAHARLTVTFPRPVSVMEALAEIDYVMARLFPLRGTRIQGDKDGLVFDVKVW